MATLVQSCCIKNWSARGRESTGRTPFENNIVILANLAYIAVAVQD